MKRGWVATLAAIAVLLASALGIVTSLATTSIPASLRWAHDGILLWSVVGAIVIAACSLAAFQTRWPSVGTNETRPTTDDVGIKHSSSLPTTNAVWLTSTAPAGNLPVRNRVFTGREEILEEIGRSLGSGQTTVVVLHGLGGVGKSQIALEYGHRERQEGRYQLVWWVRADSDVTAREDLARLASILGISADGKTGDISDAVVASLSTRSNWLIIFDNVQSPSDVALLMPSGGNVLITSRRLGWSRIGAQINIQEFGRTESVAYLSKRTGKNEPQAAADLAELLGNLPLAIAQAAAFIENNDGTIGSYLQLYRNPRVARQLRIKGLASAEYPASVAVTWLLHFRQLARESPAAISLLRLCAFLDPDSIALEVLDIENGAAGHRLARSMKDPLERTETLGALARTSLISVVGNQNIRIHRLVQTVTRDQLNRLETFVWVRRTLRLVGAAAYKRVPWAYLAPHASAILTYAHDYRLLKRRRLALVAELNKFETAMSLGRQRVLDPRLEAMPFIGREIELASLIAWCKNESAVPLQLVTGPRGVGKTRLAVELAARLTEQGWRCERVANGKEGDVIDALSTVTRGRALLVVDYAETRSHLDRMLWALATSANRNVKVLLIARSAGEWWKRYGASRPEIRHLVERTSRLSLSIALDSALSDASIEAQAADSLARILGLPQPKELDVRIESGGSHRILDLQMLTLATIFSDAGQADFSSVLVELLNHEMQFWYDTARIFELEDRERTTPQRLRQLIAAACLSGVSTSEEARTLPRYVPGLHPSARIALWLRELYPPEPNEPSWIGPILPDRLADFHTIRELTDSPEFSYTCLQNLNDRQAQNAIGLLTRASAEHPQALALLDVVRMRYRP